MSLGFHVKLLLACKTRGGSEHGRISPRHRGNPHSDRSCCRPRLRVSSSIHGRLSVWPVFNRGSCHVLWRNALLGDWVSPSKACGSHGHAIRTAPRFLNFSQLLARTERLFSKAICYSSLQSSTCLDGNSGTHTLFRPRKMRPRCRLSSDGPL
jgi:hypothetical protein